MDIKKPFSIRLSPKLQACAKSVAAANGMTFETFVALALRGALPDGCTKQVCALEKKSA